MADVPLQEAKRQSLVFVDAVGRTQTVYGCARRGCDAINLAYESFGGHDGRSYCLDHVPLRSRLRVWWQERRNG
jgi:hypothetical protein